MNEGDEITGFASVVSSNSFIVKKSPRIFRWYVHAHMILLPGENRKYPELSDEEVSMFLFQGRVRVFRDAGEARRHSGDARSSRRLIHPASLDTEKKDHIHSSAGRILLPTPVAQGAWGCVMDKPWRSWSDARSSRLGGFSEFPREGGLLSFNEFCCC
jgi:hypothetical protein